MTDRKLTVDIVANDRGFGGTMASAGKSLAGFGALALGAAGGAAIIGAKVFDMGLKLEAMDAKAKTVFEGSLGSVQAWGEQVAGSMGLTSREAVGLATNMADLLKPMGFTAEQAADMSTKTADLAGALSAWSGGTVDAAGAADVLTKAMLGERDGLKALGISISEADIQARLAAKGQEGLTGAALEQAKALATQELIFEKSTDAQKAWSNGTFDAIKKQNEMKASIGEAKEALVGALMPALSGVADLISTKVVPFVTGLTEAFSSGGLGAAWEYVADGWEQAWPRIQEFLGNAATALWDWVQAATPVVLAQLGEWLVALGTWFVDTALPQLGEWAATLGDALWEWIKEATPPALAQLGEWIAALGAWFVDTGLPLLAEKAALMADKLWEWVKDATPPMLAQLGTWLSELGGWLISTGLPTLAEKMAELGKALVVWVLEATPKMLAQIAVWLTDLTAWVVSTAIPRLAEEMVKLGKELVEWIIESGPDTLVKLGEWMVDVAGWVVSDGIPKMLSAAKDMGKALIDGIVEGVGEFVGNLYTEVEKIVGKIVDKVKGAINTIIRGWNSLQFKIPGFKIGPIGYDGFTLGVPTIPLLAAGGDVQRSGLAWVGEKGPELLDLPQGARVTPLDRTGGGGLTINLTVNAGVGANPDDISRTVVEAMEPYIRANGLPSWLQGAA